MSILAALLLAAAMDPDIAYVGSNANSATNAQQVSVSLTALTGGIDTAARAGDWVFVSYGVAGTGDLGMAVDTAGFGELDETYSDDTIDTNAAIAAKRMTGSPDASVTVSQDSGVNGSITATVHVLRGVDPNTPLDVAVVRATGQDTSRGNPGAITPVTPGAFVLATVSAAAAGDQSASPLAQSGSELSGFRSVARALSTSLTTFTATGYAGWISGSFNPVAFVGAPTTATGSWVAWTVAVRPA